jgi:hypothetical protein
MCRHVSLGHSSVCNAATYDIGGHERTVIHGGCLLMFSPSRQGAPRVLRGRHALPGDRRGPEQMEGRPGRRRARRRIPSRRR